MILTSQLPLAHWHEQIGDPTLADSILDRLVHNAYRIELDGELPVNTFGGSLGTGRIHGLWHIIEGALQASGRAG